MVWKLLVAFFVSGLKYALGATMCLGLFNPFLGFLVASVGGVTGVFLFTYIELWLNAHYIKKYFYRKGHRVNKRNRFLVKLKHNGGLPLIAVLTPILLSIPIGCIIATTFIHDRRKIMIYMGASVIIWGLLIFGSKWLLGENLVDALRDML
jgi:hypothetical protein